ncbi:MAG TPA: hypothetical protein VN725_08650, partial [Rhodanobacteraceae bacterium]|nr:hypothetical protein [Rhodanobacteraceae bacterium]
FGEAQAVFEKLRASGNHSEAVTYGLALVLENEGYLSIVGGGNGRGTAEEMRQAADLLRPLVYAPHPSRRVRQLYADTLNVFSHAQPMQKAVAMCDEARKILVGLGALDLSNLDATSSYADTADSEARHLLSLGRVAEAQKLEQQVYELADKILVKRPGDLHALADRSWAAELLGQLAVRQHDDAAIADYANKTVQAGADEVRFNPSDLGAWQRWSVGFSQVAGLQFERGEIAQAIATQRSLLALEQDPRRPSSLGPILFVQWLPLVQWQAQIGDSAAAAQSVRSFARDISEVVAQSAQDSPRRELMANDEQAVRGSMELAEGAPQAALADVTAEVARVDAVRVPAGDVISSYIRDNILRSNLGTAAIAALRLGRYRQAETLARRWLAIPSNSTSDADPQIKNSRAQSVLAHSMAMQGRNDEAQKALQPALAYYEGEQKAGAHGTTLRHDYAYALYVSAIASSADAPGRAQRKAALDAAAKLIAGASAEAQKLADMRQVSGLIASADASSSK